MPGLPDRPDLDQLRRQARELLRAASRGDPAAVARIRLVSDRTTLSAAQHALAGEYGYRSWAVMRADVQRRRSPLERWSFGGAADIETLGGTLLLEGLVVGADEAVLFTTLLPGTSDAWPEATGGWPGSINDEIRALEASIETGDITVADDRGETYALHLREASGVRGPSPKSIWFWVNPIPGHGVGWIELRGRGGTTARLPRSPRAVVRLGPLTPATANRPDRLPASRTRSPGRDVADRSDGATHHLDLGITLPPIDGITLQLDSLFSTFEGWSLRLRATPRWWRYGDNGNRKWSPVDIIAEDDRGSAYQYSFGGSSGRDGYEALNARFSPRLDPLARGLRLTCASSTEQIPVDLDLPRLRS
jgi:hypothetical protein